MTLSDNLGRKRTHSIVKRESQVDMSKSGIILDTVRSEAGSDLVGRKTSEIGMCRAYAVEGTTVESTVLAPCLDECS